MHLGILLVLTNERKLTYGFRNVVFVFMFISATLHPTQWLFNRFQYSRLALKERRYCPSPSWKRFQRSKRPGNPLLFLVGNAVVENGDQRDRALGSMIMGSARRFCVCAGIDRKVRPRPFVNCNSVCKYFHVCIA